MPPTYYVIELSARWLTALLVALALALVIAFAFGYGAAWSVLSSAPTPAGTGMEVSATATEIPEAEVVDAAPRVTPSLATPVPAPTEQPTPAAVVAAATPTPEATASAAPAATATPQPRAVRRVEQVFWVQILAASQRQAITEAGTKLAELGFPSDNQRMVSSPVAGGGTLYKMRVGPFPDRDSADRVVRRMQDSGFPDAWVVAP